MFKKLLLSLLVFATLFSSVLAKPIYAQTAPQWYHSDFRDWFLKVTDPANPEDIYAERYTSAQVEWVIYGYFSYLLNAILGTDLAYCMVSNAHGALTGIASLGVCQPQIQARITEAMASILVFSPDDQYLAGSNDDGFINQVFLANRPLSGLSYIREKINHLQPVQEVMAQTAGFGFEAAAPVRALWVESRDISYFLLVISIVVMAFMIMFRVKNSPQTVVTIQSTLPKIIVGIVVITFSYAIAGLMIDLMYVVIGIFAGVLANSNLFSDPNNEWPGMYADLSGAQMTSGLVGMTWQYGFFFIISLIANGIMRLGNIVIPGIGGILLVIIIEIVLLIIFFKILLALIKNFATILLLIAAAPFMILSGVVGGSGFSGWLKTLAAHLAVYPVIGVLFALSFFFLANSFPGWDGLEWIWATLGNAMPFDPVGDTLVGTNWVPPFTVIGSNSTNLIWLSISMMILSLIPKTVEIIQSVVSGKPFAFGSAIGAPMAAGLGVATAPFGFVGQGWNAAQEQLGKSIWSKVSPEIFKKR